jgi:hypothetical protein
MRRTRANVPTTQHPAHRCGSAARREARVLLDDDWGTCDARCSGVHNGGTLPRNLVAVCAELRPQSARTTALEAVVQASRHRFCITAPFGKCATVTIAMPEPPPGDFILDCQAAASCRRLSTTPCESQRRAVAPPSDGTGSGQSPVQRSRESPTHKTAGAQGGPDVY